MFSLPCLGRSIDDSTLLKRDYTINVQQLIYKNFGFNHQHWKKLFHLLSIDFPSRLSWCFDVFCSFSLWLTLLCFTTIIFIAFCCSEQFECNCNFSIIIVQLCRELLLEVVYSLFIHSLQFLHLFVSPPHSHTKHTLKAFMIRLDLMTLLVVWFNSKTLFK